MKEKRNIKNIFQIVFTFFAFFIFGAINVDAKTVSVDRSTFLTKFGDQTSDVIQLSESVDLSDIKSKYPIYIYKDKTIDLKGNTLTLPNYKIEIWYYTNATVKFIDSSKGKTGQILGANDSDGSIPLISTWNENPTTYTETYLLFDGVKISRNADKGQGYVVAPTSDKKIGKVSFINTNISNFAFLNKSDTATNYYYENITFQRGVTTHGFLLNDNSFSISDVISDNSAIIKEYKNGTYRSTYTNDTKMDQVYTDDDVIKVVYKSGISVSNVNFKIINYKDSSVSQNITITNSGEEDIEITNVSVSSSDFVVTGPASSVTLSSGSADTSWSIKPKDGLGGGIYVDVITVTAGGKTYTSTVTLTVKEVDSEGNDVVYVTTTDELSSAIKAKTKTIKLANDLKYNNGWVSIPVYGDTTIDLNGKTLYTRTGNFGLNYQDAATIKIIDSSSSKTGKIVENGAGSNGASGGIIQLVNSVTDTTKECHFVIDGVNVTSESARSSAMIFVGGDNNLKSVRLVNSLFSNYQYVLDGRGIDNITFENVKATSSEYQRIYLVGMKDGLTFGDITSDDSEVVYLEADGRYIRTVTNDTLVNYDSLMGGQSIQVRYKSGFNVTAESKTINYKDSSEYYPINITNRGASSLNITNVSIDDARFELNSGSSGVVDAGMSDTSWSIKVKDGVILDKGVYTVNISVTASDSNTYKGTFTLTVNPKTLNDLRIGGLNSEIVYGSEIKPSVIGTDSTYLGIVDYEISYEVLENGSYVPTSEVKNVGKYKAVLKSRGENYTFGEVSVDFEIIPLTIEPTVSISSVTYNGNEQRPDFTVLYGAILLYAGRDYSFTYSDNTDAGEAKVTISPIDGSNYTFTPFDKNFTIYPKSLSESDVTLSNTSYKYTGSEIKPEPVVKDGDKELVKDTDYRLSYKGDITNAETTNAKVIITGKGNYKGEVTKPFSIVGKEVQEISFTDSEVTKTYGEGVFTIEANHTKGDGVVKYTSSNTDVAVVNESTGEVTIKGAGPATIKATASETADYAEASASYKLNVNKLKINFTAIVDSKEYDGNNKANVSKINLIGVKSYDTLVKDTDYTVSALFSDENYGLSKNVTVKITLKDTKTANNYELEKDTYNAKASITGRVIKDEWIEVAEDTYTYNGTAIKPVVTVKDPTGETVITLTKDTHYRVEYTNNINAGKGKIKIIGRNNYTGEIEKEFTINKKSINPTIEDIASVIYNGSEHRPNLVVKDGSTTLVKGTDYNVEYSNNLGAGPAYAEISSVPTSNYTFEATGKEFTIEKYNIKESNVTLEYTSVVGDGNAKKPTVTVKMGDEVIPPIEYNVDYEDNTNIGTAKVIVTIKTDSDDFTGTVTKKFEIVDKTLLTISGISNQEVVYTGSPVVLNGTLTVSNGINPQDLTVKWYKGSEEITRPTDAGEYKVVYSYEDDDYIGSLTVDFEITKKESVIPTLNDYSAVVGDKLSSISLPNGFKWVDGNEVITSGSKKYNATYTENNDTTNYTTKNVEVNVYGKVKVNLTTSVNGVGGTISSSKNNIIEGTTETITLSPSVGFEISKVEVNGVDKTSSINNNKLDIVIGNSDVNVVVTYKAIQYTITINDLEHVTINPSGIIKVDYNTNKTFTIMAELGYKLVSVKAGGVEMISSIVNDELTLENILSDTEIVVVVERNIHKVIEGANQEYIIDKDKEARFKIDAKNYSFERGGSVYVDGVLVDPDNYTSEDGNIIVLKKKYLDNLSEGEHTLKIVFVDGEASTTFTVVKLNKENPKTGDNIVIYILTGIVSTLGLAGVYFYKRKQTN